ncbi:MAG: AraC family transcriptional regulator [Cyanobacteria bacterium J06555_3]
MTISLTWQEFLEQFQEADKELHFDPSDKLDLTLKHSGKLAQGWKRQIHLREGILVEIWKEKNCDRLVINTPEWKELLRWHFILSGKQQNLYRSSLGETSFSFDAGRYISCGSGLNKRYIADCLDVEEFLEVEIVVQPEVLRSFVSDPSGELPKVFKHLVRSSDRECYKRLGKTSPMMNALLLQIINCSKKGLTKRMFLESKAIELMSLLLEEEATIQQGESEAVLLDLDYRDRIHYAQEILMKNLTDPPSLMELARKVGMCDYNLKRGFQDCFGASVYAYLRDRRMEKAKQLLLEPWMTVAEVGRTVGYDSHASFTAAFKKKFGMTPKAYRISLRK